MCRYNYLIIRAPKRRACFLENMYVFFWKVAHVFKKTRTCISMEDKEGSRDKKNFYNNSLFPHHLRKIVNIHKAKKSFHFFSVSQR